MNSSEKVELILIFGECNRNSRQAARVYADRYPNRYHPHHNYVVRLLRGLSENGQFPSNEIRQRQPRPNNFDEDTELQVMAYIRAYPRSSIRHVSREIGVSVVAVHTILKKNKMHAYKPEFVQHLRIGDSERRLQLLSWFSVQFEIDNLFYKNILWTDESKFTNNGTVWGVNVWCGLIGRILLGPYFYDGTLSGRRYLDFLVNQLPLLLEDVSLATRENMYFQQDGAPAHNAIIVKNYSNKFFPNRWIGTHGVIPWPARSPDLTPLDFFLWGHLKNVEYEDPPINLQDLKNKIRLACSNLRREQINAATSTELLKRLESCLEHQGGNFEQFIR
ncbi:uncharacterized protein LOC132932896 [Metopolophium dirhodum]|uniref:uncharacterized protein LOC132932896 n=1 Tax=Metopolophium dirhodum TaxID=44670 RepID=UPI00299047D9|nr:uncharacterized protein LOC132932896 [Metopolophium dirhodum]